MVVKEYLVVLPKLKVSTVQKSGGTSPPGEIPFATFVPPLRSGQRGYNFDRSSEETIKKPPTQFEVELFKANEAGNQGPPASQTPVSTKQSNASVTPGEAEAGKQEAESEGAPENKPNTTIFKFTPASGTLVSGKEVNGVLKRPLTPFDLKVIGESIVDGISLLGDSVITEIRRELKQHRNLLYVL